MKQRFLDSIESAKDAINVRKDRKLMDSAIKCGKKDSAATPTPEESRTMSEFVADTPLLSNPTFKSGCTDVLVVRQPNGAYLSTAFNVLYGKHKAAKGIGRAVYLNVNKVPVRATMVMEKDGCAHFKRTYTGTASTTDDRSEYIPTHEEFEAMRLVPGENELVYTLMKEDGTRKVMNATIYYVRNVDKLIISDIDGTITRSDMRGHIFNAIGRDWSQVGVTKIYTELRKRGYHFLYLTSRSIEAAQGTREYIRSLRQVVDGVEYALPMGPVFTSAFRFFKAVNNELIKKVPQEFKIACLSEVAALFPGTNPLYAGFGNKPTDFEAYSKVGICNNRIFIVNKASRLTYFEGMDGKEKEVSYSDIVESKLFPNLELPPQQQQQPMMVERAMSLQDFRVPPQQSPSFQQQQQPGAISLSASYSYNNLSVSK